ncbi:unnamed protein product [Rotaria sp. Silwood2]|nr:unnamed protein product [Rotaria sp. Silwood2]CAF3073325.1 unnamed protein product [Rotaria sp. Silwood2]CAF3415599.1 unnamed protein product [Rotaria sp. Silwood2]CAF4285798.1 unnamed protein product [Rotaria sp. Silwood2]CAF4306616.1 unnamed protein product [Rotaria sp. Silwood2]
MSYNAYLFTVFFVGYIRHSVESIRCGTLCPFAFESFNVSVPEKICPQYTDQENAQCSLTLMLDIRSSGRGGGGVLMIENQTAPDQLHIETIFGLHMSLTTIIRYTCSMSDDCAWAFANELLGPKLAELNTFIFKKHSITCSTQMYRIQTEFNVRVIHVQ